MTLVSIPIAVSTLVTCFEHQHNVDLAAGAGDLSAVSVLVHRDAVIAIVLIIQSPLKPGIHKHSSLTHL